VNLEKEEVIKIIATEDGSSSLYLKNLDETYHSVHGAIQESNHVFIEAGLKFWLSKNTNTATVQILEFGFGTGLNAMLTSLNINGGIKMAYHGLEKYPLSKKICSSLNYGEVLHNLELFIKIHDSKWGKEEKITPDFKLKKIEVDFRNYSTNTHYDVIYFDAFSPSKQPKLWTREIFEECYLLLNKGGVLVTYSAKGQLKRDLKSVGFMVESIPGPPGKFEITRATK